MHALEKFEDLSSQGHGQGLGVKAKTKDLPVETRPKTLKMSPRILLAKGMSSRTPLLVSCIADVIGVRATSLFTV